MMKKTTTETSDPEIRAAIHDASLMSAQEAYGRVQKAKADHISDLVRSELRECSICIDNAVRQEQYKCELDKVINQRTVDCLKELGYDVQSFQEKCPGGVRKTIISWDLRL